MSFLHITQEMTRELLWTSLVIWVIWDFLAYRFGDTNSTISQTLYADSQTHGPLIPAVLLMLWHHVYYGK